MASTTWWDRFVDVVTVAWLGLFLVVMAGEFGLTASRPTLETVLRALVVIFIADVLVLYRRAETTPTGFVRGNWFYIMTAIPWFRPFRIARIGRSLRVLRIFARSRRAGAALNKLRRLGIRLWPGREPE